MTSVIDEYYYTKDHEWTHVDETTATVGITSFAQEQMGEIVYVDLPDEGQKVVQNEPFGAIESVKAALDLYSPLSGTILEVNNTLTEDIGILNDDPMDEGWLIRIEIENERELTNLMKASEYKNYLKEQDT